eukprot:gb/GECG01007332.1/.p1 GENE.gb/GECG01007332.1/~~gb/GECG01007332.1/.p1  ORF type:complete len:172 (+),score=15.50 gb/GECG01007332.1/:1-516(+)
MGSSLQYARWSVDPNRVIVMDAPTGCCLFDKKYRWRTAVTSHSVCNLLRSFLQLSRDIDCGELHSAQFAIADEQMELIVARSDRVFLALFHDVTNPAVVSLSTSIYFLLVRCIMPCVLATVCTRNSRKNDPKSTERIREKLCGRVEEFLRDATKESLQRGSGAGGVDFCSV